MIQHPPKELLPPAAADCTAAKIDTHRRRELETKTITCPPKRVSSKDSFYQRLAWSDGYIDRDVSGEGSLPFQSPPMLSRSVCHLKR